MKPLPAVQDNIEGEQRATTQQHLTPYNRAYGFLQQWRDWYSSRPSAPIPDCLEKPLSMKINVEEWAKLHSDFNLGETDEAWDLLPLLLSLTNYLFIAGTLMSRITQQHQLLLFNVCHLLYTNLLSLF